MPLGLPSCTNLLELVGFCGPFLGSTGHGTFICQNFNLVVSVTIKLSIRVCRSTSNMTGHLVIGFSLDYDVWCHN
jgi:hypothetical protein